MKQNLQSRLLSAQDVLDLKEKILWFFFLNWCVLTNVERMLHVGTIEHRKTCMAVNAREQTVRQSGNRRKPWKGQCMVFHLFYGG